MRTRRFNKSAWVGALVVVLVLGMATAAIAGSGKGGVFNLGMVNKVDGFVTNLKGAVAGAMLGVTNTSTDPAASALSAVNNSAAPTVRARNTGAGPAFQAIVPAGQSPLRI